MTITFTRVELDTIKDALDRLLDVQQDDPEDAIAFTRALLAKVRKELEEEPAYPATLDAEEKNPKPVAQFRLALLAWDEDHEIGNDDELHIARRNCFAAQWALDNAQNDAAVFAQLHDMLRDFHAE